MGFIGWGKLLHLTREHIMKKTTVHADILNAFTSACYNLDAFNAMLRGEFPAEMEEGKSDAFGAWADDWSEFISCSSPKAPDDEKEQLLWCSKKVCKALNKLTDTPVTAVALINSRWGDIFAFVPDTDKTQAVIAIAKDRYEADALLHNWVKALGGSHDEQIANLMKWGESTTFHIKAKESN